jgi:hypothetical protein
MHDAKTTTPKTVAIQRNVADDFDVWLMRQNADRVAAGGKKRTSTEVLSDIVSEYLKANSISL